MKPNFIKAAWVERVPLRPRPAPIIFGAIWKILRIFNDLIFYVYKRRLIIISADITDLQFLTFFPKKNRDECKYNKARS